MNKHKFTLAAGSIFTAALCILLAADSKGTVEAAQNAVKTCLDVIIPSLFAFMVFSRIVIKSGIADTMLFPAYKLCSFWFKGSRRDFSIFILSLIGGYPVGISLLKEEIAYNKNYTAIAEKMLCFCYCGSPSFIIQIAGVSVLGSVEAGLLVYASNVLSCLTAAVIINIFAKDKNKAYNISKSRIGLTVSDFTDGIASAVKGLSIVCGTILAFNIILELMRYLRVTDYFEILGIEGAMAAAFEISNLSLLKGSGLNIIPLLCAVTSFGGLCIILQTAALSENKIKLIKFIVSRIPIAILSAAYGYLLTALFPVSIEAYLPPDTVTVITSVNPICSLCIMAMGFILLKTKENNKQN